GTAEPGSATQAPAIVIPPAPNIPKPPFWGPRVVRDFDLREVFRYINLTALFKNQWQLKTASQEDYLKAIEAKYKPILAGLQEEMIQSGLLEPKAVWGYWPCQSEGNDVILYDPEYLMVQLTAAGAPYDDTPPAT